MLHRASSGTYDAATSHGSQAQGRSSVDGPRFIHRRERHAATSRPLDELDDRHLGAITATGTKTKDSRVTTGAFGVPGGNLIE